MIFCINKENKTEYVEKEIAIVMKEEDDYGVTGSDTM